MESLLIANRGEIARRIMRTTRRLGIRSIAVYSAADAAAPFVAEADTAVCIGAAPARDSYLAMDKILAAAKATSAAAIHAGYGFLSENADFADAVQAAGLLWVGAPPAAIRAMGSKDTAKALMMEAGVPVTPGAFGTDQSSSCLAAEAQRIGYPILIKAVAGGGGKGMRRVDAAEGFDQALASCRREAAAAFGDDRVLLEKYILGTRHIEVQVFGDSRGNLVHLFERDCSLQRRHQKVIEEAPAPGMDPATRRHLCAVALKAARAVAYVGAGTIEFIADASQGLRADRIWFMEMNTRLQVEHPVTEAVTGQDLVEWQLRVASGEPLPLKQHELQLEGWAMEARLYAENPTRGFLPSVGTLERFRLPSDVRVDSGVEEGGEVSEYYDPLLAKIIVHAPTRAAAARRLERACGAVEAWPVRTNAAFLCRIAADPAFIAGDIDTAFIERHADSLIPPASPSVAVVQAATHAVSALPGAEPWVKLAGFRANAAAMCRVTVAIDGQPYTATVDPDAAPPVTHDIAGERVVFCKGEAWSCGLPSSARAEPAAAASDGVLRSPMPGRIVGVAVHDSQRVRRGQTLLALEAMKMEHVLVAPFDGIVAGLAVADGDQVAENVELVRVVADT